MVIRLPDYLHGVHGQSTYQGPSSSLHSVRSLTSGNTEPIKWSWIHAYRCHLVGGSPPPHNGGNRAILFLKWNFYSKNNFKILTCWLSTLPPPHDPRDYEMAARRIVLPTGSRDGTYDMQWVRHPGDSSRIHVNFGNSRGEI